MLAAVLAFNVPLFGSVVLLYASLVMYLASIIGVGIFISAISQTQQQVFLGAFLLAAATVLLSGFASPIDNMPDWLQTLTLATSCAISWLIVKGIFLKALPALLPREQPQDVVDHLAPDLDQQNVVAGQHEAEAIGHDDAVAQTAADLPRDAGGQWSATRHLPRDPRRQGGEAAECTPPVAVPQERAVVAAD